MRSTIGRRKLLVFCAEKVAVDSMQMTATASTTGVHTRIHQRQPCMFSIDHGDGLKKKTEPILLTYQQRNLLTDPRQAASRSAASRRAGLFYGGARAAPGR